MMDHRESPGIPDEIAVVAGLPLGAGRGLFEAPAYTCRHCQAVVVLNPKRNRPREYCRRCAHLICDSCAEERVLTGKCRTFEQLIDEQLNRCTMRI